MKKNIIKRTVIGVLVGITLCYIITIIISLIWAKGYYSAAVPALIKQSGSEINAVLLQVTSSAIMGGGMGCISFVWEKDDWSIVKQTGVYFILLSLLMLPVAYLNYWMAHTLIGFVQYFGIYLLVFIFVWSIQYFIYKKQVKDFNMIIRHK